LAPRRSYSGTSLAQQDRQREAHVPIPANTTLETEARTFLPISRILCPIDFSEGSRAAVDWAVDLAGPNRAEITGVFALPAPSPARGAPSGSCALEADDNMMSAVAEDIEEFLGPARKAGLDVHVSARRGDSAEQIVQEARRREADGIVMGPHGRSRAKRWALGSVLDGVLRKAPCPVLAVPRRLVRARRPEPVHGRILCAVGLSERSAYTLSYALELARWTTSLVTVLHVADDVGGTRTRAIWEGEQREKLHAAVPPERPCEEVVLSGAAPRQILRLAEARQAGLIVLGGGGGGLGPIASRVVQEAKTPVLIVPFPSDEGGGPVRKEESCAVVSS
jgi:universal stress protein A